MANTRSAKKNIRASLRKKAHNQMWKGAVKTTARSLKESILAKLTPAELATKLQALQKAADKAAKNKAIHKNRANRLKSQYARKISALLSTATKKTGSKSKSK